MNTNSPRAAVLAGERAYVPVRATYNIEREREGGIEEIELQIEWSAESSTASGATDLYETVPTRTDILM